MKRRSICIWLLFVTVPGVAQEGDAVSFNFFPCDQQQAIGSRHFQSIEAEALRVDREFCTMMNTQPLVSPEIFEAYGLFLERTIAGIDFGSPGLTADVRDAARTMSDALGGRLNGRLSAPSFVVDAADFEETNANGGEFTFLVSTISSTTYIPSAPQEDTCAEAFSSDSCLDVFNDLENSINLYKTNYVKGIAAVAAEELAEKSARWNRFFEEARTPTFIDIWLTSFISRDHFRKGWPQGPPERQYFALHPNLILLYHDGAPQGDQFVPGISLEWAGINWWDESPIGIPFGVSIVSVYADVPEVDRTIGTGLTFHFDNNLMIGWARHGDDNSYHVSADLLQLFKDSQARFDTYKARFDSLVD